MAFFSATVGESADVVQEAIAANRRLFLTGFSLSAVMGILALTTSFYMLEVYDRVLSSRSEETLLLLTLIAFAALIVFGALDALRLQLLSRTSMRIADRLGARVLRAMITISAINGGAARQGLRDVETLRNFISSPSFAALMDAPFLLFFLFILYLLHPAFFFIVLFGGALLAGIAAANQRLTAQGVARSITGLIGVQSFVEDGLRNADVLEGMGMSETFVSKWRRRWLEALRTSLQASDRDAALAGISKAVRQLIQIALLGVGAWLVLDFHASGGVMIAGSILGGRALAPVEAAVGAWKNIIAVQLARDRLVQILSKAPKREEGMPLPPPKGNLRVQRAVYVAPSTKKVIVSNVSFELEAGEALGIVGPSGAGKTTLLRLITGAWPCASGIVRLDNADIFAWPRAELSPYIGYLSQDVELFSGTVSDNIAKLGEIDPEEVVRAAVLANADDMIRSLPRGYDTDVGEGGLKLSGGQRQRIGIARAVFGSPRLVVLDEPNSNLDEAGEVALKATMAELKRRGVTLVIVAHRASVFGEVDKLLALREGTVEAFGPRLEVLRQFAERRAARPTHSESVRTPGSFPRAVEIPGGGGGGP